MNHKNIITKLIDDTLKTNGKFSRKSLTIFVTFTVTMSLSIFIVISDIILKKTINSYSIGIVNSLLAFLGFLMGATEIGKKFINKNTNE